MGTRECLYHASSNSVLLQFLMSETHLQLPLLGLTCTWCLQNSPTFSQSAMKSVGTTSQAFTL